ncbi:MAG: hypothetical protein M5U34_24395 [Chloroflexi bacterium]|nr:hypothetical protein [Chloroflexota bacterium]
MISDLELENRQRSHRRHRHEPGRFLRPLTRAKPKTLNLVVKADVQGSLEPIVKSLEKMGDDEVSLEILLAATGNITESDVMLASASDAVILGFKCVRRPHCPGCRRQ